jgi:putative phosphoesterase
MKIALLGDVHANLPALEAVLEHAGKQKVDLFINTGDYIGYGPFPDETVRRLMNLEVVSVIGNYDRKALDIAGGKKKKEPKNKEKRFAFRWAADSLSIESRNYLENLPRQVRFVCSGKRFLLVHGSPESEEEHLTPETPPERFRELAGLADADVVLCGHSHIPFSKNFGKTRFMNPGSVGRPDDGDPRASYCILSFQGDSLRSRFFRVPYDIEATLSKITELGLPESFKRMFLQGKSLASVSEENPGTTLLSPKSRPEEDPCDEEVFISRVMETVQEVVPEFFEHTQRTATLALSLYDQLQGEHRLDPAYRLLLYAAALLHDIGWSEGSKAHHKASLRLIQHMEDLIPDERRRSIISCVARYHRKAFPKETHDTYASLGEEDRAAVRYMSAILRLADGLDAEGQRFAGGVECRVSDKKIFVKDIEADGESPVTGDLYMRIMDKGKLLEKVFSKELVLE